MKTLRPTALHAVRWLASPTAVTCPPWWSAWHVADGPSATLCAHPLDGRSADAVERSDDLTLVSCLNCQGRLARLGGEGLGLSSGRSG